MSVNCWKCSEVWHTKTIKGPWHCKTPVFASILSLVLWGQYWVQEAGRTQGSWKEAPPSGDQETLEWFLYWEQWVLLGVNPEDYRRVVRPCRWESEEAQKARRCVPKWAQAARTPSLTVNQIKKAWELENHDGISIYSDISSFDGSRTYDIMEDFDEEYTPENQTISEPTLRSITMVPGEVNVKYNSLIDV